MLALVVVVMESANLSFLIVENSLVHYSGITNQLAMTFLWMYGMLLLHIMVFEGVSVAVQ